MCRASPGAFRTRSSRGSPRNLTAARKSASRRANSPKPCGYRAENSRNTQGASASPASSSNASAGGWAMQYDFIGDIHGHADELEALLKKLGYVQTNGAYRNSGHTAVFLGDYIDRGPDVRRAVNIVRSMCEAGSALALMGNHEFYALALFLETETFRAEHACWNPALMRSLKTLGITRLGGVDMLHRSLDKSDALFAPVDELLKGPELPLPQGIAYDDSEGVHRTRVRLCWWKDPRGKTLREMALQPGVDFPEIPVPGYVQARDFYGENEKPVFFGHYWLEGKPR